MAKAEERSQTIRQEIIRLMKLRPVTPRDISGLLGISERDAAEHLAHALVTASRKYRVKTTPAKCRVCGFVFKDRKKTKKPSRCPRCKEGRVETAEYHIVNKNG
jgi:predicted Zn-ribbon and HTH transcriptional regulator